MLKRILVGIALALCGFWTISPVGAHYVWIELDKTQHTGLYFGEYQEQLREVSGGRLDKIKEPRAWLIDQNNGTRKPLEVVRKGDRFDLGIMKPGAAVIAEERTYDVMDLRQYGFGVAKPMFYARFQPVSAGQTSKPELALDILPQAGAANAFIVYFKNEPLPKAKVTVYAPNLWQQEHRSDDHGRLEISTPWSGQYVLEVLHTEKERGEFMGQSFESVRHRATLGFILQRGADER